MCDISYWYRCQTLQLFTFYQLKWTSGKTVIFPHVEMWLGNKRSGVLLHYVWQWMMILNKAASEWTCINSRTSVVTLSQSPPQEPTQQRRFFSKWTERGTPVMLMEDRNQHVRWFYCFFFILSSSSSLAHRGRGDDSPDEEGRSGACDAARWVWGQRDVAVARTF